MINIDHMDALAMLEDAYELLCEFDRVINDQLEGDNPEARAVDRWCKRFEGVEVDPDANTPKPMGPVFCSEEDMFK